jgi:hypothetical protein
MATPRTPMRARLTLKADWESRFGPMSFGGI